MSNYEAGGRMMTRAEKRRWLHDNPRPSRAPKRKRRGFWARIVARFRGTKPAPKRGARTLQAHKEEMLTADVARLLGVAHDTAARHIATGRIPNARRVGCHWYVSRADVEAADLARRSRKGDGRRWSNEALTTRMKELAEQVGRTPTWNDLVKLGSPSPMTYIRWFGSLNAAQRAAGLEPNGNGRVGTAREWVQ